MPRQPCHRRGSDSSQLSLPQLHLKPSWTAAPAAAVARQTSRSLSPDQSTVREQRRGGEPPCFHLLCLLRPPLQQHRWSWHRLVPRFVRSRRPWRPCCRRPRTPFSPNSAGPPLSCRARPLWRPASSCAAWSPAVPTHCAALKSLASKPAPPPPPPPGDRWRPSEWWWRCFIRLLSWITDSGSLVCRESPFDRTVELRLQLVRTDALEERKCKKKQKPCSYRRYCPESEQLHHRFDTPRGDRVVSLYVHLTCWQPVSYG